MCPAPEAAFGAAQPPNGLELPHTVRPDVITGIPCALWPQAVRPATGPTYLVGDVLTRIVHPASS